MAFFLAGSRICKKPVRRMLGIESNAEVDEDEVAGAESGAPSELAVVLGESDAPPSAGCECASASGIGAGPSCEARGSREAAVAVEGREVPNEKVPAAERPAGGASDGLAGAACVGGGGAGVVGMPLVAVVARCGCAACAACGACVAIKTDEGCERGAANRLLGIETDEVPRKVGRVSAALRATAELVRIMSEGAVVDRSSGAGGSDEDEDDDEGCVPTGVTAPKLLDPASAVEHRTMPTRSNPNRTGMTFEMRIEDG